MIPILTSKAMRRADELILDGRSPDFLVKRAGTAVALQAKRMLGQCYGSKVAVLVGPGLNGADGVVASQWLRSRGAHVEVFELASLPTVLEGYDLIIDAVFGIGCSRDYVAPLVEDDSLILAVDVPSGVDADSGVLRGAPMRANVTIAIGALKPVHLTGEAQHLVGEIAFASLDMVPSCDDYLMGDSDLYSLLSMAKTDHKWKHAVEALVGSTRMPGAAELVLRGALAGGASMVRLSNRGDIAPLVALPPEVVHTSDDAVDSRCRCVIAGPGLGLEAPAWLREKIKSLTMPLVLDADGLDRPMIDELSPRDGSWVLTPHDGEFARLTGQEVGANRFEGVRTLAKETGCVVLLKGPTTIIANPMGDLRVVNAGTSALATAGTGDVLAGLIGATIARGHGPFEAAALAAHLHGRAGANLLPYASASDLVVSIQSLIASLYVKSA